MIIAIQMILLQNMKQNNTIWMSKASVQMELMIQSWTGPNTFDELKISLSYRNLQTFQNNKLWTGLVWRVYIYILITKLVYGE